MSIHRPAINAQALSSLATRAQEQQAREKAEKQRSDQEASKRLVSKLATENFEWLERKAIEEAENGKTSAAYEAHSDMPNYKEEQSALTIVKEKMIKKGFKAEITEGRETPIGSDIEAWSAYRWTRLTISW